MPRLCFKDNENAGKDVCVFMDVCAHACVYDRQSEVERMTEKKTLLQRMLW